MAMVFNFFDAHALVNARLRGARDRAAMRLPDPQLYGCSASYRWAYAAALVAIAQDSIAKPISLALQLSLARLTNQRLRWPLPAPCGK